MTLASACVDRPQFENEKSSAAILKPLSIHNFPSPSSGASKSVQCDAICETSGESRSLLVGDFAPNETQDARTSDELASNRKGLLFLIHRNLRNELRCGNI